MRTVGIVTPWIAHPELLGGYLGAVAGADHVMVIDNGGAPSSPRWEPLRPAEPLGFAASNNLGAEQLQTDIVVFLNNDVWGDPAWIDQVREQVEDGALYGPSIGTQTVGEIPVPYVEGWCVAATRDTWERVGEWDAERFPKPYWEDVELSLRAVSHGVELRRAPWPVNHLGGTSTATVPGAWDGFEEQRQVVEQIVAQMTGAPR